MQPRLLVQTGRPGISRRSVLGAALLLAATFPVPRTAAEEPPVAGRPQLVLASPDLPSWRRVHSLAFSPDGLTLATGHTDRFVRLWDLRSGALRAMLGPHGDSFPGPGDMGTVYAVAFAPDGRTLAAGTGFMQLHSSPAGEAKLWELPGGTLRRTLTDFAEPVEALAYAPDGKLFATASRQREQDGNTTGVITLRDGVTGSVRRVLTAHHPGVFSLAFSRDGRTLATGGNGEAKLWSVDSGKEMKTLTPESPAPDHYLIFHSVALSPDGRTLAAGTASIPQPGRFGGDVRLWDLATGKPPRTLTGHTDLVTSVAFSPDGKLLASGSYDHTLKLWDARTGTLRRTLTGHTEGVNALAFSPDGRHLASASQDGTVRLWNVADGALLVTLQSVYPEPRTASREWLATTPAGYYDCSPGAQPHLRWQIGDHSAPLEQYETKFHRPDQLRRALQ